MSLLVRINAAMGVVFIDAAFIAGYCCWSILEANARREVLAEAGLMMDSALVTRAYTANEILPLLEQRVQESFPPQSIPFYARSALMGSAPLSCGSAPAALLGSRFRPLAEPLSGSASNRRFSIS